MSISKHQNQSVSIRLVSCTTQVTFVENRHIDNIMVHVGLFSSPVVTAKQKQRKWQKHKVLYYSNQCPFRL